MISCMLGLDNDSIDPEREELLLDKLTLLAIELLGDHLAHIYVTN